jgi:hypothetical protein
LAALSALLCAGQSVTPSPARMYFVWQTGGPQPAARDLTLSAPAGTVFTVQPAANWLRANLTQGTAPGAVRVSVDASGLGIGRYVSNLAVSAAGATEYVRVELAVTAASAWTNLFTDVPPDNSFFEHILLLRTFDVTIGCVASPPQYCPNTPVTRGQMAAFLARALWGETFTYPPTPYYTDVPPNHPYFHYIQKITAIGLLASCGAGRFCPNDSILRTDMAAALIRAAYGENFSASPSPYFSDVGPSSPYFRYIQKLREIGTTQGCTDTTYCPNDPVTRWQMAGFLARHFFGWKPIPLSTQPTGEGACPIFPADNVWNTPIDTLPVHPNSAAYVTTIGATARAHADFGSGLWAGGPIGIPYVLVPGSQPKVPISFYYSDESDPGPYPIPPDAPIEGGPQATGDRHILVIDKSACKLYEVFDAHPQSGGASWNAGSGAVFDLNSNALRPLGWTSADAAGLPIFPGLVRYEEVAAGEIRHALRFTAPQTQRAYIWPARHFASSRTGANYPPMGLRFRLKSTFDMSTYSPEVQVILRALKKYGMILADNGSAWFVSGSPDPRWNNDHLAEFGRLRGSDFEAVDTSGMQVDGSARARQPRTSYNP